MRGLTSSVCVAILLVGAACSSAPTDAVTEVHSSISPGSTSMTANSTTSTMPTPTTTVQPTTTTTDPYARPEWLGTLELPLREDEHGQVEPTPEALRPRELETIDLLPAPQTQDFESTVGPVPPDVRERSTWTEECPVTLDELAYITVSHWGFDQRFHTGEMIVNAAWAEDAVEVFRKLHDQRFPIEQMRVIRQEEVDAHPTGDWNETTSFVCRPAVGSGSWSRHAYGLAIDINPFHNPYLKDDLVLPELATYYTDRSMDQPGMIHDGDPVVDAFAAIGWPWGGNWNTLKDWMHFSDNGR